MSGRAGALGRGFSALATAAILARAIDAGSTLLLLLLLTRRELGAAAMAVAIGTVVEALNGLGTSEAIIQARTLTRRQLDTVFAYVTAASLLVGSLVLLAAPLIAHLTRSPSLALYLVPIAAKQPVVAAAVVPLALLNRRLRYERIAAIGVAATLGAAVLRVALALAGAGAWAMVGGYVASGVLTLAGALLAHPFRPGTRLDLPASRGLARFGLRAATANLAEQFFKNVDFLLVGAFFGAAPLATYKVAFDIAMEPAMAIGTVVNRTALPVFARAARDRAATSAALAWSLGRIATLAIPLAAATMLAARPLTALLHDGAGVSYVAAATPLLVLAAAAPLRLVVQLLAAAMLGGGRPGAAARLSGVTLAGLVAGVGAAGLLLRPGPGLVAVSAMWLLIYPVLLPWAWRVVARPHGVPARVLARAARGPALAALLLAAVVLPALAVSAPLRDGTAVAIVASLTAFLYAATFAIARRRPPVAA